MVEILDQDNQVVTIDDSSEALVKSALFETSVSGFRGAVAKEGKLVFSEFITSGAPGSEARISF